MATELKNWRKLFPLFIFHQFVQCFVSWFLLFTVVPSNNEMAMGHAQSQATSCLLMFMTESQTSEQVSSVMIFECSYEQCKQFSQDSDWAWVSKRKKERNKQKIPEHIAHNSWCLTQTEWWLSSEMKEKHLHRFRISPTRIHPHLRERIWNAGKILFAKSP